MLSIVAGIRDTQSPLKLNPKQQLQVRKLDLQVGTRLRASYATAAVVWLGSEDGLFRSGGCVLNLSRLEKEQGRCRRCCLGREKRKTSTVRKGHARRLKEGKKAWNTDHFIFHCLKQDAQCWVHYKEKRFSSV